MPSGPSTPRQRFTKPVGDPRDARGLYAAMRRFLEHRGITGSTESSLYNLERYIRDFIAWADARSVTHPEHVSQAVLERYQRHLYYYRKKDGAALSIASRRAKIVPLRSFFKWLTRTGHIPANPASELDLPKSIRRLPRHVLSVKEVERVMACTDIRQPIGLRDRAIMEVLYATGMRRMEITHLQISDIDIDQCVVLIREGKGRKDRLIPLGERALYWVQLYLDQSRPQLAWNLQEHTLFLSREGTALNESWLSTTVAQYVKRAELGKHGGCHLFRHTMATLMLEGGADIRFIQVMLGHAEMSTTQIYTQVAIRQLQQVHASTHPGAQRRVKAVQATTEAMQHQEGREQAADALFAVLDREAEAEAEEDEASP
ncbi:tyrosine recombinase XerD [Undibacterium sp. KW1]|uniref:site-specific tyrosine recombinase XerC n=1 Tax=Undibacterium sp. KW1 TaxID=2058624 RepID=UPI001331E526|nr:site-specific tyrosine recombinase XerC [Undibacterium sp. KW1]BBB62270.1 tyrosine recombinase XerD [Undibacterium sp. KW1]BBB62288.1 tyrosine recombinase XerD [Undibacterium sp. KW1]